MLYDPDALTEFLEGESCDNQITGDVDSAINDVFGWDSLQNDLVAQQSFSSLSPPSVSPFPQDALLSQQVSMSMAPHFQAPSSHPPTPTESRPPSTLGMDMSEALASGSQFQPQILAQMAPSSDGVVTAASPLVVGASPLQLANKGAATGTSAVLMQVPPSFAVSSTHSSANLSQPAVITSVQAVPSTTLQPQPQKASSPAFKGVITMATHQQATSVVQLRGQLTGQPAVGNAPQTGQAQRMLTTQQLQPLASTQPSILQPAVSPVPSMVNINMQQLRALQQLRPPGAVSFVQSGNGVHIQGLAPTTLATSLNLQGMATTSVPGQMPGTKLIIQGQPGMTTVPTGQPLQQIALNSLQGLPPGIVQPQLTPVSSGTQLQAQQHAGLIAGQQVMGNIVHGGKVVTGAMPQMMSIGGSQPQIFIPRAATGAHGQGIVLMRPQMAGQPPQLQQVLLAPAQAAPQQATQTLQLQAAPVSQPVGHIQLAKLAPAPVTPATVTTPPVPQQPQTQPQQQGTDIAQTQLQPQPTMVNMLQTGLNPTPVQTTQTTLPSSQLPVQNLTVNINGHTINIGGQNITVPQPQGVNLNQLKNVQGLNIGNSQIPGQTITLTAEQLQQNPQLQQQLLNALQVAKQGNLQQGLPLQTPSFVAQTTAGQSQLTSVRPKAAVAPISIQPKALSPTLKPSHSPLLSNIANSAVPVQPQQQTICTPAVQPAKSPIPSQLQTNSMNINPVMNYGHSTPAVTSGAASPVNCTSLQEHRPTFNPAFTMSNVNTTLSSSYIQVTVPPNVNVQTAGLSGKIPISTNLATSSQRSQNLPAPLQNLGAFNQSSSQVISQNSYTNMAIRSGSKNVLSSPSGSVVVVSTASSEQGISSSTTSGSAVLAAVANAQTVQSPARVQPQTIQLTPQDQKALQQIQIKIRQLLGVTSRTEQQQKELQELGNEQKNLLIQGRNQAIKSQQRMEMLQQHQIKAAVQHRQQKQQQPGTVISANSLSQTSTNNVNMNNLSSPLQHRVQPLSNTQPFSSSMHISTAARPVVEVRPLINVTAAGSTDVLTTFTTLSSVTPSVVVQSLNSGMLVPSDTSTVQSGTTSSISSPAAALPTPNAPNVVLPPAPGSLTMSPAPPAGAVLPPAAVVAPVAVDTVPPPLPGVTTATAMSSVPKITSLSQLPRQLQEHLKAQLAKMSPEQQQLFQKNQAAVLTRLQLQLQQKMGMALQPVRPPDSDEIGEDDQSEPHTPTADTIVQPQVQDIQAPFMQQGMEQMVETKAPLTVQLLSTSRAAVQTLNTIPTKPAAFQIPKMVPRFTRKQFISSQLRKDQNGAVNCDYRTAFRNPRDALKRLLRFHVFQTRTPTEEESRKSEDMYDELASEYLEKSDTMKRKFQELLLLDSTRLQQTSEMVMLERLFLAQEKDLLEEDKRLVEEEPDKFVPNPFMGDLESESKGQSSSDLEEDHDSSEEHKTGVVIKNEPIATSDLSHMNLNPQVKIEPLSIYTSQPISGLKIKIKSSPHHIESPKHIVENIYPPVLSRADVLSDDEMPLIKREKTDSEYADERIHVKKRRITLDDDHILSSKGPASVSYSSQFEAFLRRKGEEVDDMDTKNMSPTSVPFQEYSSEETDGHMSSQDDPPKLNNDGMHGHAPKHDAVGYVASETDAAVACLLSSSGMEDLDDTMTNTDYSEHNMETNFVRSNQNMDMCLSSAADDVEVDNISSSAVNRKVNTLTSELIDEDSLDMPELVYHAAPTIQESDINQKPPVPDLFVPNYDPISDADSSAHPETSHSETDIWETGSHDLPPEDTAPTIQNNGQPLCEEMQSAINSILSLHQHSTVIEESPQAIDYQSDLCESAGDDASKSVDLDETSDEQNQRFSQQDQDDLDAAVQSILM